MRKDWRGRSRWALAGGRSSGLLNLTKSRGREGSGVSGDGERCLCSSSKPFKRPIPVRSPSDSLTSQSPPDLTEISPPLEPSLISPHPLVLSPSPDFSSHQYLHSDFTILPPTPPQGTRTPVTHKYHVVRVGCGFHSCSQDAGAWAAFTPRIEGDRGGRSTLQACSGDVTGGVNTLPRGSAGRSTGAKPTAGAPADRLYASSAVLTIPTGCRSVKPGR